MEKKNLILIVIILIIVAVAGLLIFFNVFPKEEVETPQNENQQAENQQEQQNKDSSYYEEEIIERKKQRKENISISTKTIIGTLYGVNDEYFVIKTSTPQILDSSLESEIEEGTINVPISTQDIKINIDSLAKIFKINDEDYIMVPSNITQKIDVLNYLYNYINQYDIYIYAYFNNEQEIENTEEILNVDYIEWSAYPKK